MVKRRIAGWVRAGAALVAGGILATLAGCGSSGSGGVGTPVTGTFIDAPVQGLGYKSEGWIARDSDRNWSAITSSADGSKLAAVVEGGKIYTSTDSGVKWTEHGSDRSWRAITSSADGSKLAAVVAGGQIWISTDSGNTWSPQEENRRWVSIASSSDGSKLAATDGRIFTNSSSGWTRTPVFTPGDWITSSADGSKLAAAVINGRIYTSTDSGNSWNAKPISQIWSGITSSSDGNKLAAVVAGGRIYTSTDSGNTWNPQEEYRNWRSITSSSDGSKLAAVANADKIYTSTDSGSSWNAQESSRNWRAITSSSDGSKLAAVVSGGQIYTNNPSGMKLTGASGSFDCAVGQDVTFSLGNQVLGAVKCGETVHVYHMAGASDSVEKGVRVARLLQSLNTSSDSSKIVLPDLTGITVNVRLTPNDTDFENDVQALMTALNGRGLVNTTPVTRATAVAHVQTELNKLSATQKTNLCSTNHCNSELLGKLLNPAAVQVAVSGLTDGQPIELQMVAGGSTQPLKLQGKTGTTLSASFVTAPTTGQTYTVSRSDINDAISCTLGGNATGAYDPLSPPTVTVTCATNTPVDTNVSFSYSGLGGGKSFTADWYVDGAAVATDVQITDNTNGILPVGPGKQYEMRLKSTTPSNLQCSVTNGSGTTPVNVYSPATSTITASVVCTQPGFSVGGTVTGLGSSDTVGLVLYASDRSGGTPVRVTGANSGASYAFPNVSIASGSTFSVALDGAAPTGYACAVSPTYASATPISANVTDANVVCDPISQASVSAITPQGSVVAGAPAAFAVTGSSLPLTAILVLDGVECSSATASSSGFVATCTAPANAGTVTAQVKTDTAANSGVAIGSGVSITVTSSGGGGGGGGGGSCGAPNTAAGSVGGYVTGLTSIIGQVELISHDDINGIDSETVTVVYGAGCTTHYFAFSSTPLMRTVRSNTAACSVTANASVDQTSNPSSVVNNVTVTCQ